MLFSVYNNIEEIKKEFSDRGCKSLFVKLLATNQDNEKNQIYLGYSHQFLSLVPGQVSFRTPSQSRLKRGSQAGRALIETKLNFYWLEPGKREAIAPRAKIIDYFQYPEMRLSGFLAGCQNPPDALRREKQDEYGRRILILGISNGAVYGLVLSDQTSNLIDRLISYPLWQVHPMFHVLSLSQNGANVNPAQLINELEAIGGALHASQVLRKANGTPEPFRGTQGAGWTLEALLNIPRNSSGDPDKYGFELKAFLSSKVTLMTPEPDFGIRYEEGLRVFLEEFGWAGEKDDDSLRFNGKHDTQRIYPKSGLKLVIQNWDHEKNLPDGKGPPNVVLVKESTSEIAAGWTFDKLAEKWGRKHAGAMYVQAEKYLLDDGRLPSHYSFGPNVYCGLGTSALLLMKSIASGLVYLDPGDRIDSNGEPKKRTQWRLDKKRGLTLGATLAPLYDEMTNYQLF